MKILPYTCQAIPMKNYLVSLLSMMILFNAAKAQQSFSIGGSYAGEKLPAKVHVQLYQDYFRFNTILDTIISLENRSWQITYRGLPATAWLFLQYAGQHAYNTLKNRAFLVRLGDSVRFTAKENRHMFTGVNAGAYNIRDSIEAFDYPVTGAVPAERDSLGWLLQREKRIDSVYAIKQRILDASGNSLPAETRAVYAFDMITEKLLHHIGQLRTYYNKTDTTGRSKIRALFNDYQSQSLQSFHAPDIVKIRSANYGLYLYEYARMSLYCTTGAMPAFPQVSRFIAGHYTGIDRGKAMLCLFADAMLLGSSDSLSDYLQQAKDWISYQPRVDLLETYTARALRGAPAYPFRLENANGGFTSLSDLKGKVVVVDYWYTGCPGCVGLAKKMPAVIDSFAGRNDIAFVTISIDEDKNRWKKSVQSQIYCHAEEINLYTGGQKDNHPAIRFYGIRGYPTLHIIDKNGNIFDTAPPKPSDQASMLQFLSKLRLALQEGR